MKISKKTALAASFCIGALMLVTAAFADVAAKTGYEQLKDSIKYTANSCVKSLNNYTFETTMTLKDNDQVLFSASNISKIDRVNQKKESNSSEEQAGEKKQNNYSYSDKKRNIYKNSREDIYHVYELSKERTDPMFDDPFEDEHAADLEKIFDAATGDLKNAVLFEEQPDGTKQLSGKVSEAQIPALVNAVCSYTVKQEVNNYNPNNDSSRLMPQLSRDIVIKTVEGKAIINKDGLLENIYGPAVLTGKDKSGKTHELIMEVLVKLEDINSTKVTEPDLTGKKVEKEVQRQEEEIIPQLYQGTYKNNIVIVKENKFVKIGERTIEIAKVSENNVEGRYSEKYTDGYGEYSSNARDLRFDAKINKENRAAEFTYTDAEGHKYNGHIYFNDNSGKIYFNFDTNSRNYDSEFNRVFAD